MFNVVSRTNETRHIKWHGTCKWLDSSVFNNKQPWNEGKCRCESKIWLIKACAIKDLFGILVIVSVIVINCVMLVSIWTMKIVSAGKN